VARHASGLAARRENPGRLECDRRRVRAQRDGVAIRPVAQTLAMSDVTGEKRPKLASVEHRPHCAERHFCSVDVEVDLIDQTFYLALGHGFELHFIRFRGFPNPVGGSIPPTSAS
jgi:hypothetical protein